MERAWPCSALSCSFSSRSSLLVAELSFAGLAAERGLGHSYSASVILAAAVVTAVAVFSGARGVTPLQAVLCGVLVAGLMITLMLVGAAAQGIVLPHITYGGVLQEIGTAERTMLEGGLADLRSFRPHTKPFLDIDELNFVALFATLMAGNSSPASASYPVSHAVQRTERTA